MHLTLALRNTSAEIQQKPGKQTLVHTALACVDVKKWQSNIREGEICPCSSGSHFEKENEVSSQVLILKNNRDRQKAQMRNEKPD